MATRRKIRSKSTKKAAKAELPKGRVAALKRRLKKIVDCAKRCPKSPLRKRVRCVARCVTGPKRKKA